MHGRAIKVAFFSGHSGEVTYVVAAPDWPQALAILKTNLQEEYDQFEDAGRVSKELLQHSTCVRANSEKYDSQWWDGRTRPLCSLFPQVAQIMELAGLPYVE
jgi:hypothetical protein